MNEEEIRFIDLFAGVGGFHLGLTQVTEKSGEPEQVGGNSGCTYIKGYDKDEQYSTSSFRCVWANEWDKYAASVYRYRFPETPLSTGDIREVPADSIPDHDLLCAGFPCQAFSVAGKRRGLEEARGTLFYEIARIAERKRPRLLLLENVKGLLSHDEGRTFATILRVMGSVGYRLEWQVLNSKWFGVPQNRERVFIVGHLGDEPIRTVFPITEIGGEFAEPQGEAQESGSRVRDEGEGIAGALRVGGSGREENLIAGTLSHRYGKDGSENLIQIYDAYNHSQRPEIGTVKTNESSPTSSSNLIVFERPHGKAGGDKDLPCLRSKSQDSQLLRNSTRIRRLTPVECERLQAFPDGWTELGYCEGKVLKTKPIWGKRIYKINSDGEAIEKRGGDPLEDDEEYEYRWKITGSTRIPEPIHNATWISDTQRYKMMGNAVTVNVIRFIGTRIQGTW